MIPTPRAQMTLRTSALVALDAAALWAGWQFASTWRFGAYWGTEFRLQHQPALLAHAVVFLLVSILFETYDPRRPYATWSELRKLLGAYVVAGLIEVMMLKLSSQVFSFTPLVRPPRMNWPARGRKPVG